MLERKILRFPHKAILTAAMLEEMYAYPREILQLRHQNYCDGIIGGMDYALDGNGDLILSAGLFKHGGAIYVLSHDLNIGELAEQRTLKIDKPYFVSIANAPNVVRHEVCLKSEQLEIRFTERAEGIVLGQFVWRGRTKFKLPNQFDEFFNRSFINVVEIATASRGEATFHPIIFRAVKKFLASKAEKTFMDYAMFVSLQNGEVLSRETLDAYIAEEGKAANFVNRSALLQTFFDCLKSSKPKAIYVNAAESKTKPGLGRRSIGKMI